MRDLTRLYQQSRARSKLVRFEWLNFSTFAHRGAFAAGAARGSHGSCGVGHQTAGPCTGARYLAGIGELERVIPPVGIEPVVLRSARAVGVRELRHHCHLALRPELAIRVIARPSPEPDSVHTLRTVGIARSPAAEEERRQRIPGAPAWAAERCLPCNLPSISAHAGLSGALLRPEWDPGSELSCSPQRSP